MRIRKNDIYVCTHINTYNIYVCILIWACVKPVFMCIDIDICIDMHTYKQQPFMYKYRTSTYVYSWACVNKVCVCIDMGWLRLGGSLKL